MGSQKKKSGEMGSVADYIHYSVQCTKICAVSVAQFCSFFHLPKLNFNFKNVGMGFVLVWFGLFILILIYNFVIYDKMCNNKKNFFFGERITWGNYMFKRCLSNWFWAAFVTQICQPGSWHIQYVTNTYQLTHD